MVSNARLSKDSQLSITLPGSIEVILAEDSHADGGVIARHCGTIGHHQLAPKRPGEGVAHSNPVAVANQVLGLDGEIGQSEAVTGAYHLAAFNV